MEVETFWCLRMTEIPDLRYSLTWVWLRVESGASVWEVMIGETSLIRRTS